MIKCGKLVYEQKCTLKHGNGTFPFIFFQEDVRLKFEISVDTKKKTFTMDVQERRFESLPYRPCAIHLDNDDDGGVTDIKAAIEVNDIDILGSRKNRRQETMTWNVEAFEKMMKEKLNNTQVRQFYIVVSQGSSVAVNELLAAIYAREDQKTRDT